MQCSYVRINCIHRKHGTCRLNWTWPLHLNRATLPRNRFNWAFIVCLLIHSLKVDAFIGMHSIMGIQLLTLWKLGRSTVVMVTWWITVLIPLQKVCLCFHSYSSVCVCEKERAFVSLDREMVKLGDRAGSREDVWPFTRTWLAVTPDPRPRVMHHAIWTLQ